MVPVEPILKHCHVSKKQMEYQARKNKIIKAIRKMMKIILL